MAIKRERVNCGVGTIENQSQSVSEFFNEQLRRKFMKLPLNQKNLIREAQAAGLQWKGEDTHKKHPQLDNLTHFEHVYREWKLMKEIGVEEYRKRALAKLDSYTRRNLGRNG